VAGITAVTARRPRASPAALATGTLAGAAAGLVMAALPPMGNLPHLTGAWLTVVHGIARGVAVPLVLGGGVAAGLMAARRTPRQRRQRQRDRGHFVSPSWSA
jgi:hypothetical protein